MMVGDGDSGWPEIRAGDSDGGWKTVGDGLEKENEN